MLLIREIFHCKPGRVRPLVEKFKTMNKVNQKLGLGTARLMTDLSGERYWTVVSEWEVKSLTEFEEAMGKGMENKEVEEVMKDYHELVDHGHREIYTIEA